MKNRILQSLAAIAVAAFTALSTQAASITWGAATTIAGDTDVSTTGSSVCAFCFNTAQTINGVPFALSATTPPAWLGPVSSSPNIYFGTTVGGSRNTSAFSSGTAPYASLSAAYKAVLQAAEYASSQTGPQTVILTNLTVGHPYTVQFWVNDPRGASTRSDTLTSAGGNSVTLLFDTDNTAGSPGQYSIGTFTADATTQSFTVTADAGGATPQMNAIQLRDSALQLPTFTPSVAASGAGYYYSALTTVIASAPGSTIFYTTNGTTPTASSPSGASPLTVSVPFSMTIKAYATNSGIIDSAVATTSYTILPPAPPITWGTATTIAGNADVSTNGLPACAFCFGTAQTVNGVAFTLSTTTPPTLLGAATANPNIFFNTTVGGARNTSAFGSASTPYAGLSAEYKAVLQAAQYASGQTGPQTAILTNLTVGHSYAVQFWVNDARGSTRSETLTNAGGNSVALLFCQTGAAGSPGQYSIGTFTANATIQEFSVTADATGQTPSLTAIQLRDVTPALLATPTFSPPAGTYFATQAVVIATAPGATIFYTTDGSTPTTSSTSGISPLTVGVPVSQTLKAYATNSGNFDSVVASASYVIIPPADGVWTNLAGGSWVAAGNWTNSAIASGTNRTADFSTLMMAANTTVTLDGPMTIGNLLFNDVGSTYAWTLNTGTGGPLKLAVNSGAPIISNTVQTTIGAALAGSQGVTKSGSGTLDLRGVNTFTGPLTVNGGTLNLVSAGSVQDFTGSGILIHTGATVNINNNRYNFNNSLITFDASGGGTFNVNNNGYGGLVFMGPNTFATTGGAQNILGGTYGPNMNNQSVVFNVTRGSDPTSDLVVQFGGSGSNAGLWNTSANPAMTKTGDGILEFATANAYAGGTVISNGTLLVSAGGTIANGPVTVSGGTLLVNGAIGTGALTVQSGGTLGGNYGQINGPVTVQSGGTLMADPAAIGGIFLNGTLSLAGNVRLSINGDIPNSDVLSGMTGVTYGGTLTVTNLGVNPLTIGQSFTLFTKNSGTYNGNFSTLNLPPLALGLSWDTTQLSVNGSISVIDAVGAPAFNPPAGGYVGPDPLAVTISSTTPGATIYYSMDGWVTTNTYSAPVNVPVNTNLTLLAYAHLSGYNDSGVASATYATEPVAIWTSLYGGSWATDSNWTNNIIPNNSGATADFSTLTLSADGYVSLDGSWTVGNLVFGDAGGIYNWDIYQTVGSLTLDAGTNPPTITVVNQTTTFEPPIGGAHGFIKAGAGTLTLAGNNSYSGGTVISQGTLDLASFYSAGSDLITLGDANTGTNDVQLIMDGVNLGGNNVGVGNNITVSTNGAGTAAINFTKSNVGVAYWYYYSQLTLARPTTLSTSNALSQANIAGLITGSVGTLTLNGGATGLGICLINQPNDFTGTMVLNSGNMATYPTSVGIGNPLVMNGGTWSLLDATAAGVATAIGSLNGTGTIQAGYQTGAAANQILSVGNDNGSGTFDGVITNGGGGDIMSLLKNGTGMQTLTGANTYTGTTTVSNGTLRVNGSLASGSAVTVTANGTLGGNGTLSGPATVAGTLSPGASIGTLTFSNTLTLSGNTLIEVDKAQAQSNDVVNVTGLLTYGGTLTATNIGGTALVAGDSFQVFPAGGSGNIALAGSPGAGLTWSFNPASGVLSVVGGVNTNPTNITYSVSGGQLTLGWPADHTGWTLQAQTNTLNAGLTPGGTWYPVSGSTTTNSVTIPIDPANPAVFYRLVY